jgi:hypothetical protein
MAFWLQAAAWIQTGLEQSALWLHRVRRWYVLPAALMGGRDMVLTRSGQWMDASIQIPADQVEWLYDVERQTLTTAHESARQHRMTRWPWLAATCEGRDMTDFFASLRISAGHHLSVEKMMLLFASQKGWMPVGELIVTKRDGMEERIQLGRPGHGLSAEDAAARVAAVDYIR